MVTKPTINLNGTSPGELLEQHLLAINGLRSAISTLRAAASNARDYQTERLDAFALAMNEHRDQLARLESVMDELEQLANLFRISDETRSLCRSSAGLAQLLLNRFQPVPESAIYGAGFSWRDSSPSYVAQYSALKHCNLV